MTGYCPPAAVWELDFAGTRYEGMEVTVRDLPLGMLLDILEGVVARSPDPGSARSMYALFAGLLVSWNITDTFGDPVPVTLEGLLSLSSQVVAALVAAWTASLAQPPSGN